MEPTWHRNYHIFEFPKKKCINSVHFTSTSSTHHIHIIITSPQPAPSPRGGEDDGCVLSPTQQAPQAVQAPRVEEGARLGVHGVHHAVQVQKHENGVVLQNDLKKRVNKLFEFSGRFIEKRTGYWKKSFYFVSIF